MKNTNFLLIGLTFLLISSCESTHEATQTEEDIVPKTAVQVVGVSKGSVDNELTLFGTTIYLKRNTVTAPIPAFINEVHVKLGDKVNKGDILYVLQSKESRALGNDIAKIDSTLSQFGIVQVKASASGIISTLDKQQSGDYVLEGTQLCTIAESNDLVFQVNVPYEFAAFAKTGKACTVLLPDKSVHPAVFTRALTTMNMTAQTQTILARGKETLFLPENLVVKVNIKKAKGGNNQKVPKSCVQTDEMMQEYWVMKMQNDSIAVKQTVLVGNKDADWIEIISPKFEPSDRIISIGNFGLPDTALVDIQNSVLQ
ncbi:efflux RND transporter periplasmic adaptor subunit [Marinilongibacter aquaticus]|uniref:efflux RND transporter periplasmic adaptor subunit n=1 Tax=Marinilongibacter aquaticus TaxID=2975157 RepID=UPI0021BDE98B|nr:efflux RND transporter periplasmic adaptor subunit [Marinilongibacter aquaticus]UBM58678.1 efflux RND transporter periplasmic adaptor subunit [Marinilongibacter aquaticus]